MKFVIAPDSFKGSLTSEEVCHCIETGIRKIFIDAEIISIPVADGGEGSLNSIINSVHGKYVDISVFNPLGQNIKSQYGISNQFAIIEMARASGLTLINSSQYNPFLTSTYGTGQLIKHAIENGYKKIILCIGGSATVDGGAGMAQALGIDFYDNQDNLINDKINNQNLSKIKRISTENLLPQLKETEVIILSDVTNPLLGKNGSVYVYAKQKGAKESDLKMLEANIKSFYDLAENSFSKKVRDTAGSGAAGGLGAGLLLFCNARIENGIDYILKTINFEKQIINASFIFTGEGKIDKQTSNGKVITGILKAASKYNIPVIAIAGSIDYDLSSLYDIGLTSAFSICNSPLTLEQAMLKTNSLITSCTENICRTIRKQIIFSS